MDFVSLLVEKGKRSGYHFDDIQLYQYEIFYKMIIENNKYMNLTSILSEEEFIDKHIIDSLSISNIISFKNISKCIDVGTGAGFPGIPLKIYYPDTEFILLDSLKKRINFIGKVIEEAELRKVKAIHGRAEDFARDPIYREQFDLCVSRAVASLPVLLEYCIPYIKVEGRFISYKSKKGIEEIEQAGNSLKVMGSRIEQVEEFSISEIAAERVLIKVKKEKKTNKVYPRKSGIPSRKPL